MYLSARQYLSKYSSGKGKKANEVRKLFPEMFKSGNLDSIDVKFEVGYWRKANAIHAWFVTNCQDGKDECQDSYVSREKLKELRESCKKVLKSLKDSKTKTTKIRTGWANGEDTFGDVEEYIDTELAEELLPSQPGFFFGGTEYDDWYISGLKETIKIINKCLKLPYDWSFEYCSSW